METLISDGGPSYISHKVKDILRTLLIGEYRSEPYHQHQNKAENRYQTAKRMTNALMNATGCPANTWLLCLEYVCDLLNHTSSPTHSGRTPLEALSGRPPDITHLLFFPFWDEVYYRVDPAEPNSGSYLKSSKTFFALCLLGSIDPNLIINTRIRLKTGTRPSNV